MSGERAKLLLAEAAPQAAAVPASRRAGGAAGRPRRAPRSPQPSCWQCWAGGSRPSPARRRAGQSSLGRARGKNNDNNNQIKGL